MERIIIGKLKNEVVKTLRENYGFAVISDDIALTNIQLLHFTRSTKEKRGASISMNELERLPEILEEADFFYDTEKNNIVAVYDNNIHSKQVLKIVIAIDHFENGCNEIRKYPTASIRTIGRVLRKNIKEKHLIQIK